MRGCSLAPQAFADIKGSGFAALSQVPFAGLMQMALLIGWLEINVMKVMLHPSPLSLHFSPYTPSTISLHSPPYPICLLPHPPYQRMLVTLLLGWLAIKAIKFRQSIPHPPEPLSHPSPSPLSLPSPS